MKNLFYAVLFIAFALPLSAQRTWVKYSDVNPQNVQIARDTFGVPHIFGKTDAEVAYGFGFATCEDNFEDMQFMLLAAKNMMGRFQGKDGAAIDYIGQLLRIKKNVMAGYDTLFSPEFKKVIAGYVDGVNAYAIKHPKEIKVKGEFPLKPQELIMAYTFGMVAMSWVEDDIKGMIEGTVAPPNEMKEDELGKKGSNGFAFSNKITTDGKTYLDINSHQPLEGPLSWYEAHLCSEEGWNILGGTFPGGAVIFHGVNENLGWAHTVNKFDNVDVYQLEMHPKKKNWYKFDGKYEKLDVDRAKLKVKLNSWLTLGIGKKIYWSKYGATVKSKNGKFYAIRFPAYFSINAMEQWYKMNKAKDFNDFKAILNTQKVHTMNTVYADNQHNIYYLFNGLIPVRDTAYNWQGTLPGNTSKTLWTNYYSVSQLPQVENPDCGYIYNCNNTPFSSSCGAENPKPSDFPKTMGIQTDETNRSMRFDELMNRHDGKFSYEDFKKIKYDIQIPDSMIFKVDLNPLFKTIDMALYPDMIESFTKIRAWNRTGSADNTDAALVMLTVLRMNDEAGNLHGVTKGTAAPESFYIDCVRWAKEQLVKYFGSIDVKFGDVLRHAKGDVEYPVNGFPDVLAAAYPIKYKDGKYKVWVGDSYIMLVKFETGKMPEIETINCYGSSNRPDSPHYTDQMKLYSEQKTKPMTLDKEKVLKAAKRIYHPD